MTEKEALMAVLDGKKVIKNNWGDGVYMYFDNGKLKKVSKGREYWFISDDYEEDYHIVDETVLTDKERDYLGAVIEPFRDKVGYIQKKVTRAGQRCYIRIGVAYEEFELPCLDSNEWFVNMVNEKEYTLGELGL